jgi:hypothetical protein
LSQFNVFACLEWQFEQDLPAFILFWRGRNMMMMMMKIHYQLAGVYGSGGGRDGGGWVGAVATGGGGRVWWRWQCQLMWCVICLPI